MFEREVLLNQFVQSYVHRLMSGVKDEQLTVQPSPGSNTPLWIIGHLTIVADFGLRLLGRPLMVPADWHKSFGGGSVVNQHVIETPTAAALMERFDAIHRELTTAAIQADATAMLAPQHLPYEFLRMLPTVGDVISHLLTVHPAVHTGQLSAWRRQIGLPGVLSL